MTLFKKTVTRTVAQKPEKYRGYLHSPRLRLLATTRHTFGSHSLLTVSSAAAEASLLQQEPQRCRVAQAIAGHSDLIAGQYEGGLKVWECSLDLCHYLAEESGLGVEGGGVLEVGCGAGLPAMLACTMGARSAHFQDFNQEVLETYTMRNVELNGINPASLKFFYGDWSSFASLAVDQNHRYDLILTAETIYNVNSYPKLLKVFSSLLAKDGIVVIQRPPVSDVGHDMTDHLPVWGVQPFVQCLLQAGRLPGPALCAHLLTDEMLKKVEGLVQALVNVKGPVGRPSAVSHPPPSSPARVIQRPPVSDVGHDMTDHLPVWGVQPFVQCLLQAGRLPGPALCAVSAAGRQTAGASPLCSVCCKQGDCRGQPFVQCILQAGRLLGPALCAVSAAGRQTAGASPLCSVRCRQADCRGQPFVQCLLQAGRLSGPALCAVSAASRQTAGASPLCSVRCKQADCRGQPFVQCLLQAGRLPGPALTYKVCLCLNKERNCFILFHKK
ncbi:hypothetical protein ACOMHN_035056 [Nucella lapillus]